VGEVRCFPAAGFWTAARFQPYLRIARLALASIAALAVMAAGPALSEPGTVDSSAPGMASGRPPMVAAAQRTIAPAVPAPVSGEMPPLGPAGFNQNLSLQVLPPTSTTPAPEVVTSGAFESRFQPIEIDRVHTRGGTYWLRLQLSGPPGATTSSGTAAGKGLPVLVTREEHEPRVQIFAPFDGVYVELPRAVRLPEFGGGHAVAFILPRGLTAPQPLYARVSAPDFGIRKLGFQVSTLDVTLARAAAHSRMISLAFGALAALSLGSFLIWCILSDRVFGFYSALFFFQALYIVFLSGQAAEWPLLSFAVRLNSYAWNVPIALGGAAASLFVRDMADIRVFSPRAYSAFGWFAVAFVVLTLLNFAKPFGFESLVNGLGNILFLTSGIFTLWISFSAWRHGSRAAGWFLLAWVLLEVFSIATTLQLLFSDGETGDALLYYYGLPFSMVAAAVLTALGVADRLRGQRIALTEAERRAQTDPLTGVLNRRSLIERLDTACTRARTRGLPISLLFIDLDHFKEINDTFGHPAGDACLHAIVGPIQSELRQSDVIGRYGGEEFIVILSSADSTAARPIAERILRRVAEIRVEGYGEPISLTCSIGIATSDMLGVWGQHLIARADAAVYVAKRAGRNCVQFAEPLGAA
jgi:diguanylate cyclase (GGDEF)-like protein